MLVCYLTTKTHGVEHQSLLYSLPALPRSSCCPVQARSVYTANRVFNPEGPALILPDGSFLTASILTKVLRIASSMLVPSSTHLMIHSLRRGAVQVCLQARVPLPDIQEARSWRSSAMNADFTQDPITQAPLALAYLLG